MSFRNEAVPDHGAAAVLDLEFGELDTVGVADEGGEALSVAVGEPRLFLEQHVDVPRLRPQGPGSTDLRQTRGRSDLPGAEPVRVHLNDGRNGSPALDEMTLWKAVGAVVRLRRTQ